MCDERERLIEYVYGEVAASDREQVEAHLKECHVCRTEVSGLRSVRDDLLAWDVPVHDPVWRPVAPVVTASTRRSWPAWALATAAGAVFTAGLAGGVAVREWTTPVSSTSAASAVSPPAAHAAATVTADDLARLEAVILERVRAEMAQELRTNAPAPSTTADGLTRMGTQDSTRELEERLAAVERWRDDQISLNVIFNGNFGRLNRSTSNLSEQIEMSRMQLVGLEGAAR